MLPRTIGDYSPMKLGASTRAVSPESPRLTTSNPELDRLEAELLEAEEQRDRARQAWEQADERDKPFLLTVYRANVACVCDIEYAIGKLTGGSAA